MKLQDQVISLESAKKLKELGVEQDSLWYWQNFQSKWGLSLLHPPNADSVSAFTVAELGEMLPPSLWNKNDVKWLAIDKGQELLWSVEYTTEMTGVYDSSVQTDKNEAEARAKMIVYLLEKGLIKNQNQ